MTKISVLLPVYNTDASHLAQAIDSVLAQSFSDFELLIYNDASTQPQVEETVRAYQDQRIRYVAGRENIGIAAARNVLIEMATGEYLAVMDHDDLCHPRRFEKQLHYMDRHPQVGVCGTGFKRFGQFWRKSVIQHPQEDAQIRTGLFFRNVLHHPSAMIRRSVMVDHHIRYDARFVSCNDRYLFMDIAVVSQLHNLPEILCRYRVHQGMTSRQKRQAIIEEQKILRRDFLTRMGASLSDHDFGILNDYVVNGRCRIRDVAIIRDVEHVLAQLSQHNARSGFFPVAAFDQVCAQYLIKRCYNAAVYGRLNSKALLARTSLPVHSVPLPFILTLVNLVGRRKA